ncbi:DUF6461 domain-containing protein [Streptomyces sp. WMMB303]|uniref:DUF6461 domain-containing protein n=1 Tax=Streptomyces sp. WMMB303 TaxID=3034154 RepID=UPI0023ED09B2|nr:DUF6461 domain-containing protein [Streptomyces sp. WMMB303]MDF4253803.1 DUF6461 domain-containing protein [Streptomyces sp. WMMB303]
MKLLPNSELYDTGYCALFVRRISPADILSRISGDECRAVLVDRMEAEAIKMAGEDLEEEDVPELDIDELRSSGMICADGPLLRAGTHEDWCFVIESEGPYLAKQEIIRSVSRGAVALSALKSETGITWISYAEDEEILSSFDPLLPQCDTGLRPDVLDNITGYREAIERGAPAKAHQNALRKIQYELGCAVPQEADAPRLLAVRIPGGY